MKLGPGPCALACAAWLGMGCSGSAETGDGIGGSGGDSETNASSATGTGGSPSNCAVDCASIKTPQCQTAVCDEMAGQCKVVAGHQGEACDDGQFCTVGETCKLGLCVGGSPNECGLEKDACSAIACDEPTMQCSKTPLNDGTACIPTSGDLCQVNAVCQNSLCVGTPKDCFFSPTGECNVATCNPATGKCEGMPDPAKNGQICYQSGDPCMVQKTCSNGDCIGGVPKNCSIFTNGCNNGLCDPVDGQCYAEPIPEGGICLEATDDCNNGICDANGNCNPVPANEAAACNDGNQCTMGETCLAGACQGGSTAGYESYFTETFASNAAGWTLDTEWQIGSATASNCGFANEDPGADHTPTADNGVAGVVIGGCASTALHDFYWLTSPAIDVSAAPGPVYLEFWRLLNSDYTPFMDNHIDVYDGASWINVWASGPSDPTTFTGIEDLDWTHVSYDITAYKNAAMKVRFGFNIDSAGVFTESSWNIDDVVIANAVCN